jgi:hypothetical protein
MALIVGTMVRLVLPTMAIFMIREYVIRVAEIFVTLILTRHVIRTVVWRIICVLRIMVLAAGTNITAR